MFVWYFCFVQGTIYRQVSNIRRALVGNEIVDHSDVLDDDLDVFFCSVFIVSAAQIVCHMFYYILFNFNLLMLWQWNDIS